MSCCCTLSEAVYISSFFTVAQIYQLHLFLCASSTFLLHLIALISHLPFRPWEVGQWKRNITDTIQSCTLCCLSMLLTPAPSPPQKKLEVIHGKEMTVGFVSFIEVMEQFLK